LGIYDQAYQGLTQRSDPIGFRNFLLSAPTLFHELGERLGAVDHMISFWRYRFPKDKPTAVTGHELADIFNDFEYSLNYEVVGGAKPSFSVLAAPPAFPALPAPDASAAA
jgi:hypothetical protein